MFLCKKNFIDNDSPIENINFKVKLIKNNM